MKNDLKNILNPLDDYLARVDKYIVSCFDTGIEIIDKTALHLFEGGGKRIRASLVILTSGLKNKVPDGIIELAAATEIVHAASLIHDDIIDKSRLRRGNVSVPRVHRRRHEDRGVRGRHDPRREGRNRRRCADVRARVR